MGSDNLSLLVIRAFSWVKSLVHDTLRCLLGNLRDACGNLCATFGCLYYAYGNLRDADGNLRTNQGNLRYAFGKLRDTYGNLRDT